MMTEMGLLSDGRAIGSVGNMASDKGGVGVQNKEDVLDINQFRTNLTLKYHQTNEDRAKGMVDAPRCYICQAPGHMAKDCKYGLT